MLRYRVTGGRDVPAHDEQLEIDGRAFRLWRSSGAPVAGQFAGTLAASEAEPLDQAIADVAGVDPPSAVAPPGSPAETIETADGRRIDLGYLAPVAGPWGALSAALRGLLDGLTDRPLAAVALEVADDGTRPDRPPWERADRGGRVALRIAVLAWQGTTSPRGPGTRAGGPAGRRDGRSGWNMDPFTHGLPTGDGYALQVAVDFALRARRVASCRRRAGSRDQAPEASRSVD
jgi:hypothetical protein